MQLVEILEMYINKLCNTSTLNKKDNSNDLSLIDEAAWHTAFIFIVSIILCFHFDQVQPSWPSDSIISSATEALFVVRSSQIDSSTRLSWQDTSWTKINSTNNWLTGSGKYPANLTPPGSWTALD